MISAALSLRDLDRLVLGLNAGPSGRSVVCLAIHGVVVVMMQCWVKYTRAPPLSRDPWGGGTDLGRHSVHTLWAASDCAEVTSRVPGLLRFPTRLLGVVNPRIPLLRGPFPPNRIATPFGPSLSNLSEPGGLRNGYVVALNHSYFCVSGAARRLLVVVVGAWGLGWLLGGGG